MKLYSSAFKEGYRDYVFGFELSSDKSLDYRNGWYAARIQFMNDLPYDDELMGGYRWW